MGQERVIVIGAGDAGRLVEKQLYLTEKNFIGFVDDQGKSAENKILGTIDELKTVVIEKDIEEIILAIPSLKPARKLQVIEKALATKCKIKIIPSLKSIQADITKINCLRDIQLTDLINREEVFVNERELHSLRGKCILITGAGGSIGSEICKQIVKINPSRLVLVGHGEDSIYQIYEYLKTITNIPCERVIADIRDYSRMNRLFAKYRPDIVYHTAAHKHVPLMQINAVDAVSNNIFGTINMVTLSDQYKVEKFVLISTDKAIEPTNIMGATKKIAEMYIQSFGEKSNTVYTIVRFGNVLGSKGSVIPLFQKQIRKRQPITITNPEMTRYFMSIPEASRLVLLASAVASENRIFVLNMGEPLKIIDLAKKLIKLSGLNDIPIQITEIRSGEKISESLFNDYEVAEQILNNRLYKVHSKLKIGLEFKRFIEELVHIEDDKDMRVKLFEYLEQYALSQHNNYGVRK